MKIAEYLHQTNNVIRDFLGIKQETPSIEKNEELITTENEIEEKNEYLTAIEASLAEGKKPDFEILKGMLESSSVSEISDIPREYISFDLLMTATYHEPEVVYNYLPEGITNKQIMELLTKDSLIMQEGLQDDSAPSVMYKCIDCIPDEYKNEDFVSELRQHFYNTPDEGEVAYSIIIQDLGQPEHDTAFKAMNYFRENRFQTEYDPTGADDSWGRVCGCYYYINQEMPNPANRFDSNLFTIKEWHDLVAEDTRMIDFVPKEVVNHKEFWESYQDFVGKGEYLNHPDYKDTMDKFDEYEVFRKMPDDLKSDPEIIKDLLARKAVSFSFVQDPKERHYKLIKPEDYTYIPPELRERDCFKDVALRAFELDKWNILEIPEKFVTKEMVSEALSYDMELCRRVPIHFLSEDLLIEKIKTSDKQGFFNYIRNSGEHPKCIDLEIEDHKKVLQYIPEEFKTEALCREALKVNPENEKFLPSGLNSPFQEAFHAAEKGDYSKFSELGAKGFVPSSTEVEKIKQLESNAQITISTILNVPMEEQTVELAMGKSMELKDNFSLNL